MVSYIMADAAKDREECAQQLVGLATCLPYVGGQAKTPTPDCCTGLKQVLKDNKNCLCVIIRDRNDPELGQQINVTLALAYLQFAMPLLKSPSVPVCILAIRVVFHEIQSLLHLDPSSPEAQIFYQLGRSSNQSDGSPAPTPNGVGSSASAKSEGTIGQDKNEGCYGQKRWLRMEIVIAGP
ncbi:hypothetical protein CMV_020451 [Castanea mollissima]|uniref:Bifunctional inhibitor/plant lipid transfer protein/seed storage helical domain-containing protein n=1 Tax=Castanea mollissima TaxID=60419 RepID=A0A8J4QWF6_9ROSI|nr:hypothetical protein CMV_020451 [Castanea mollissima]